MDDAGLRAGEGAGGGEDGRGIESLTPEFAAALGRQLVKLEAWVAAEEDRRTLARAAARWLLAVAGDAKTTVTTAEDGTVAAPAGPEAESSVDGDSAASADADAKGSHLVWIGAPGRIPHRWEPR